MTGEEFNLKRLGWILQDNENKARERLNDAQINFDKNPTDPLVIDELKSAQARLNMIQKEIDEHKKENG